MARQAESGGRGGELSRMHSGMRAVAGETTVDRRRMAPVPIRGLHHGAMAADTEVRTFASKQVCVISEVRVVTSRTSLSGNGRVNGDRSRQSEVVTRRAPPAVARARASHGRLPMTCLTTSIGERRMLERRSEHLSVLRSVGRVTARAVGCPDREPVNRFESLSVVAPETDRRS